MLFAEGTARLWRDALWEFLAGEPGRSGDVMTWDVVTVNEDTPYREIVDLMTEWQVSALPVVDASGAVVGLVSQVDLLYKLEFGGQRGPAPHFRVRRHAGQMKATGTIAADLMSMPAVTIPPDASVVTAAKLMDSRSVKRLPVLNDSGDLVGIVSRGDLLRVFLRSDDELRDEVATEVVRRVLWASPEDVYVHVSDGVITVALLKYKSDHWAGYVEGEDERGKDFVGLHHLGFWVDDIEETEGKIEKAGGKAIANSDDITDFDISRPNFRTHTRRGLYGAMAGLRKGPHQFYGYGLVQQDYNGPEVLVTDGVSTRFEYDSFYLGVGAAGAVGVVLPRAAGRAGGPRTRRYKGGANATVRHQLIDPLIAAAPWLNLGNHEQSCRRSDHILEAVIAALNARAAALGQTTTAAAEQLDAARIEGWIALPTDKLADFVQDRSGVGRTSP